MTVDDVKAKLAEIIAKHIDSDDEAAHGREDDLYEAVLQAIADGATNGPALAREALKTKKLHFARWCA